MKIIPIFVVIWVIARLAFDYGYKISPSAREPGIVASVVPSILCLTMLAYYQWLEGPWVLSILAAYRVRGKFCYGCIKNRNFLANSQVLVSLSVVLIKTRFLL